jgi:peptidoglycan/LPS O-acetylase OafA/YrhL
LLELKYYKNLDGLRAIAALMVVIFHYFNYSISSNIKHIEVYQSLTEFGQHGVSLFFVLSGFVITRILIKTRGAKNYFKSFYWKRALRILPLYYLFLILFYSLYPIITEDKIIGFNCKLPFFIYIQNFKQIFGFCSKGPGHYWSLAVEEHFYLFWPIIVYYVNPKRLKKVIITCIVFVLLLKIYMLGNNIPINKFTLTRIDQIFLGGYLAINEFEGKLYDKKDTIRGFIIIFITTVFIMLAMYFLFRDTLIVDALKYLALGLAFYSLIGLLITVSDNCLINKFLSSNILMYLGRISYGIYIWHILAILVLNNLFVSNHVFLDLPITIVATIVMAHISYYYLEIRFLNLKNRYFRINTDYHYGTRILQEP